MGMESEVESKPIHVISLPMKSLRYKVSEAEEIYKDSEVCVCVCVDLSLV